MSFLQTLGAIAKGIHEGKTERQRQQKAAANKAFQEEQRARMRQQWQEYDLMAPILKQREEEDYQRKKANQIRTDADNQFVQEPMFDTSGLPFGGLIKDAQLAMGASRPSNLTVKNKREMDYLVEKLRAQNEAKMAQNQMGFEKSALLKMMGINASLAKSGISPIDFDLGGGGVGLFNKYQDLLNQTSSVSPRQQRLTSGRQVPSEKIGTTKGKPPKRSEADQAILRNRLKEWEEKKFSMPQPVYEEGIRKIYAEFDPQVQAENRAKKDLFTNQARVSFLKGTNPAYRAAIDDK